MQDTLYPPDGNLLRTHTSNVQIRYMEDDDPPVRLRFQGDAIGGQWMLPMRRSSIRFHFVIDEG